jgi:hypothetical protein
VRPFVETGGRAKPEAAQERFGLERITLLYAVGTEVPPGLSDKEQQTLTMLQGGALSLIETASYLELPVSLTKVVVADLITAGHLKARPPIPVAAQHDTDLLRRVLDGLRGAKSAAG